MRIRADGLGLDFSRRAQRYDLVLREEAASLPMVQHVLALLEDGVPGGGCRAAGV